jgi:long-chain fatty acid transport protein
MLDRAHRFLALVINYFRLKTTKGETTMKKLFVALTVIALAALAAPVAMATNGDNLIGVGPTSRAMGGVGIAAPQDAISAVFANPAAMCFGPYCPSSEFNFAGTLFAPKVETKITNFAGTFAADSEENIYTIPAIGFAVPLGKESSAWRFGLAAYGVSGLGVDYRGTAVDNSAFYGPGGPMVAGEYTSLQIMKFAPSIAFQASPHLSFGLATHVNYGMLDLRNGTSSGYAFGVQPGMIYKPTDNLSLGLTYVSPQKVTHKNVLNFGALYDLDLESPQQLGLGLSYDFAEAGLLLGFDAKWLNWSDADGYSDFDWEDQWVYALGARFKATESLSLMAGYNYGKNPVKNHNGFNGNFGNNKNVQGISMPTYYYETFRIVGFPAIVEHHLTLGLAYQFSDSLILTLGYMHAFENDIKESGIDLSGQPVTIESTLSEASYDFGITWRF